MDRMDIHHKAIVHGASSHDQPLRHGPNPRAQRTTLLIRAAKLVTSHGEFVCVIRDISPSGVAVRLFHDAPWGDPVELHMASGKTCEVRQVRVEGSEVAYEFASDIDLDAFIAESMPFPKRGLRLGLFFPAILTSISGTFEVTVCNLSQQGAELSGDARFAIDQPVTLTGSWPEGSFGPIAGKVRWRRGDAHGVVFEDTLKLADFARLSALLQCPALLHSEER